MSDAGGRAFFWKWVERVVWVLGGAAAVVAILVFVLEYQFVKRDRYKQLLDLEAQQMQGEPLRKEDSPAPQAPAGSVEAEVDQATILAAALGQLIQEANDLATLVEEPDSKHRFDRWRSSAKERLMDGQKLISASGWTSRENWVDNFHAQTHVKRDLDREPYRPEELRGFLQSGSLILERMRSQVLLLSGKVISPAETSFSPGGEG